LLLLFYCVSNCIAALLGADVILTNLPYRLRLLRKNVGTNLYENIHGSVVAGQVIWGEKPVVELIRSLPNYGTKILYLLFYIAKFLKIGCFYNQVDIMALFGRAVGKCL